MPEESQPTSPRLLRIVEVVYAVDGVVAARVWSWPARLAIGVKVAASASPPEVLRRIEQATSGLREGDEAWEFGLLEDDRA